MMPKRHTFSCVFVTLILILVSGAEDVTVRPTNEFLLQFDEKVLSTVKEELLKVNITYLKQILPGFFLFRDDGNTSEMPDIIKNNEQLKDKVSGFERVQEYVAELWTKSPISTEKDARKFDPKQQSSVSTYFDMGVEGAWQQNYTGKGIFIAVTDVGVNNDVEDLKPNIETNISYNAVDSDRSSDVTPEQYDDYHLTMATTDHGNRCAGMISALRNGKCGDGVAYEAKIAVRKIFKADDYDPQYPTGRIIYRYTSIADGLTHAINDIDIFSNSWGSVEDFNPHLPAALVVKAIEQGVRQGRGGRGIVHVFPVGAVADPFANSIFTVAVNSVGKDGVVPEFASTCACTLTAAYGEGCNSTINPNCDKSKMLKYYTYTVQREQTMTAPTRVLWSGSTLIAKMTASRRGCTIEFNGVSASTAIVSGIIALALQANPKLGWREVQDIVVRASGRSKHMTEYNHFLRNGAGRYYHPDLGFGLLNATKLVTLARDMHSLPPQVKIIETSRGDKNKYFEANSYQWLEASVIIPCTDILCVTSLEHVVAKISFQTPRADYCEFMLISPANTSSLLMNRLQVNETRPVRHEDIEFLSVNFWGEKAEGQWRIVMKQYENPAKDSFEILDFRLTVFGTGRGAETTKKSVSTTTTTPKRTPGRGSPLVALVFVGILGFAAVLFSLGFYKMLQNRPQNRYSEMKEGALDCIQAEEYANTTGIAYG